MVDIHIRLISPDSTVIRAPPSPRSRDARVVDHDILAIPLQDHLPINRKNVSIHPPSPTGTLFEKEAGTVKVLPGVAATLDRVPVLKGIAVIGIRVRRGADGEARELGAGGRLGGNTGL